MKKLILTGLIPVFIFLSPFLMISGGVYLTGCSPSETDDLEPHSAGNDTLLSATDYVHLNNLLRHPTYQDIPNAVGVFLETTKALDAHGYFNPDEWRSMLNLFGSLYGILFGEEDAPVSSEDEQLSGLMGDGLYELLTIAADTEVGKTMKEFNEQAGPDFLTAHVYPMLEYAFIGDDEEDSSDADNNKISQRDFNILMGVLRRMLDKDDATYGPVWAEVPSVWAMLETLRNYGTGLYVSDIKNLLSLLIDILKTDPEETNPDLFDKLTYTMEEVWEDGELEIKYRLTENGILELDGSNNAIPITDPADYVTLTFQDELRKLIYSTGLMMTRDIDNSITDFSRILDGLEDLLNDETLPRNEDGDEFRVFVENVLDASSALDGSNSLGGILRGIGSTDPAYLQGLDYAVDYIFKRNREGVLRDDPAATSQTSAARVLLYMIDAMNGTNINAGNFIGSSDGGSGEDCTSWFFGSFVKTYPECTNDRSNVMDWTVGEISNALDLYSDPFTSSFEGFDQMLFGKDYRILLPAYAGNGLLGLFLDNMLQGAFMSWLLGEVAGFNDFLPSTFVGIGAPSDPATPGEYLRISGKTHQLLAPAAPVIQHFWKWEVEGLDWVHPMVEMGIALNEINNTASFVNDNGNGFLKTVEGAYGYGPLTYALRSHSTGSDPVDNGILDPVLNMLSMTVTELIDTRYTYAGCEDPCILYCDRHDETCTLFSGLMKYLENNKVFGIDVNTWDDKEGDTYNVIADFFEPDTDGDVYLDDMEDFINRNHILLTVLGKDLGNILVAIAGDPDRYTSIMSDIEEIMPILEELGLFDSGSSLQETIDHLLEENPDGSDNPFMFHAKALAYKAFDVQDAVHHPAGTLTDNSVIGELPPGPSLIPHLFGDETLTGGVYSLCHVKDFTDEVEVSDLDLFSMFIEDPLEAFIVENTESSQGHDLPSSEFYRSLFISVDVDGNGVQDRSLAYLFLDIFRLENTEMDGVLKDMVALFATQDLYPGGYLHEIIFDMLTFADENMTIE